MIQNTAELELKDMEIEYFCSGQCGSCSYCSALGLSTGHCPDVARVQRYMNLGIYSMPIRVATRSQAWVCGRSVAGMAGSNPAGSVVVSCECCVFSGRGLLRADHSPRTVLPSVVCLSVIVKPH
jgi:hypothetical protein